MDVYEIRSFLHSSRYKINGDDTPLYASKKDAITAAGHLLRAIPWSTYKGSFFSHILPKSESDILLTHMPREAYSPPAPEHWIVYQTAKESHHEAVWALKKGKVELTQKQPVVTQPVKTLYVVKCQLVEKKKKG